MKEATVTLPYTDFRKILSRKEELEKNLKDEIEKETRTLSENVNELKNVIKEMSSESILIASTGYYSGSREKYSTIGKNDFIKTFQKKVDDLNRANEEERDRYKRYEDHMKQENYVLNEKLKEKTKEAASLKRKITAIQKSLGAKPKKIN